MNNEEVLNIKNLLSMTIQQLEDDFQSHLLSNRLGQLPILLSLLIFLFFSYEKKKESLPF